MIFIYILIITTTIFSAFASFFIKKSTNNRNIVSIIKNKNLYFGGFLYIFAALLNIYVLKRMPYNIVVCFGSITYIWTMIISRFLLKENINIGKIVGVMLIIIGVICIAI